MLSLAGPSGTGVGRRPEADSCWPADQGDGAQNYGRTTFERDEVAAVYVSLLETDGMQELATAAALMRRRTRIRLKTSPSSSSS